jgi:predicted  nucleic acid-binding Zn-ribbon protein
MEELKSLADLLDLQEVDLQIDRLLDRRQHLPELERYRTTHEEVARLTAEKESADATLRTVGLDLDKAGGELELTETKAAREENRLYAGGLSARDADYLRREVELLRGRVGTMEEEVLELLEARENAEGVQEKLAGELETVETEKTDLEKMIREQWRIIDAEIALKEQRKVQIVPTIDESLLELYDELRDTREGAVVGHMTDGVCGVCHLKLSAAEEVHAKREDPPRCIHCRAILVP